MPDDRTARWHRADAILAAALDRPAAERDGFVRAECAGDEELLREVLALLAGAAASDSILDGDAAALAAPLMRAAEEYAPHADGLLPGARVGAYRVVRELARGGMGAVYLAERDDDEFRKAVALKVVKRGIDTDEVLHRFRAERQILAGFAHPNIASLLDGGATDDGRPYLVMEYVPGRPITEYCDDRRLTIDERLALFETACAAVQHAHQNLVIHRDVKPSNVLVSDDGVVKLLDFGVAKMLTEDADAPRTRAGVRHLTPEYASPEQMRGDPVTTASDVYSLGVLLYELLTGVRPFVGRTSDGLPSADDRREIRRPSTAWTSSVAAPAADGASSAVQAAAATRGTTADRLRRRLRGDLDTIVLKALAAEPARRYSSVEQLREDLERHRAGLPVRARPDTARYRLGKFVRRNRTGVAGAAIVALLVIASTVVLAVQQRITARERDRAALEAAKASEVRDFLVSLFTSSQPNRQLGDTLSVGDVLELGAARIDSLDGQPQLRALLLVTIGDVYRVLGRYDRAEPLLTRAVREYDLLPDAPPLDRAGALTSIANMHFDLRQFAEARAPTEEALEIQRRELGPTHPDVLTSLGNLATLTARAGDIDSALVLHREVLAIRRSLGPDEPSVGVSLNNIGTILVNADRLDEAEPYLREALELQLRILPREHPDVALAMSNLGSLYREQGRLAEAEELYREALTLRRSVLGQWHPRVGISHYQLGRLYFLRGVLDSAEAHLRATLEIDRRVYGDEHPEIATDAVQLARVLLERGDPLGAEPLLREALAIRIEHRGEEHAQTADALDLLARAMRAQGSDAEARRLLRRALAASRASRGADDSATIDLAQRLAALGGAP